jgi:hypothetical protein
MRYALPFVAAGLLAACTLPPYTTPEQSFSVKYSMFVPSFTQGIPLPTGLPAFADKPAPSSTVPIPKEAKTFKLAALELNLKMKNTGPVPLRIKIFLDRNSVSESELYATAPLGGAEGQIDLPRGGTEITKAFPIDVALLQEESLRLGYTFGSPGTQETVTFKDSDQVNVAYSIKATAKLF